LIYCSATNHKKGGNVALNLCDYDTQARESIKTFWKSRDDAQKKQKDAGKTDQGERGGVTGGKNMDGFSQIVIDLVKANGLPNAEIYQKRTLLTLPGFFRPTKLWDLLVIDKGRLIAAVEFKSHVGPSFGNNFNNRTEEAIGTAHDLRTAYRDGAFGKQERPFVGWLMVVEDTLKSRTPVKDKSAHFPVFPDFVGASYLKRYDVLCQKLTKEQLYSAAAVIATPRTAVADGAFVELSAMTGLRSFVASFAGHIAAEAAR
jgi:Restriction endonuclease XhoI